MRIAQIVVTLITVAVIVKFGFAAVVLLLLILAAVYVVGAIAAPIMIRATTRVHEKPPVRALELDDASIPENARAELLAHRDALGGQGFELVGVIHFATGPVPTAYLAVYRHSAHVAGALSRVILKPGSGWPAVQSAEVEFETRYENGDSVELSNVAAAVQGIELAPGLVRQMPQTRDVALLFVYFLKLVAKYESDTRQSAAARVPVPADATPTSILYEQLERSYRIQHRRGLLEPAGVPGVWRPTWRMAFRIAAAVISPGLEFVKRRLQARGERLRRELDGDSTLTSAERIGARNGKIMLTIGLALSTMAVVMAPPATSVVIVGMALASWLVKRRGREPGWRALAIGGIVAMLLIGVPTTLLPVYPPGVSPESLPDALPTALLFLLPMAMLILGTTLAVEGFRAAAT